ncbi:MAG: DJ-1/PfpI family protein [Puniceicoccales bacterium]|jgi:4-methyl-5(b-hydroxyethyl)-thiazole monophosphate biosynthesis|nr:DJ-1/PfpI family protein [Puniceicoccales bacterium]
MKKAVIVLFTDFEEIEAISTIDVLRRGGVKVTVASLTDELAVTGAHGITCFADVIAIPEGDFDALIIPGGPGVLRLRGDKALAKIIQNAYDEGKLIGAICAAPILLHDLGILEKHHHTCHFSMAAELKEARTYESVVSDGNVITGCGPGAGIKFGLAILEFLNNVALVREVAHGMMSDF